MEVFYSVFLGQEKNDGFSGFTAQDPFFCVLEVPEGCDASQGRDMLEQIAQILQNAGVQNLSDFDRAFSENLRTLPLPVGFSLAAAYRRGSLFYLKTIGEGEIVIRRANTCATIISGTNNASGRIETGDLFIFSTKHFTEDLEGIHEFKKIPHHKKPAEIVEVLTPVMKSKSDEGAVGLFLEFHEAFEGVQEEKKESRIFVEVRQSFFSQLYSYVKARLQTVRHTKKGIILLGVVMAVVLFIANSGRLFVKKNEFRNSSTFESVNQQVRAKINEAQTLSSSDLKTASEILADSHRIITEYAQKNKTKEERTRDLEQFLKEKEIEILRIKEGNQEEFYDLKIEDKTARGDLFSPFGDSVAILDKKGSVYIFSLDKKSLKQYKKPELVGAELITLYEDRLFIFNKKTGVIEITETGEVKKVIPPDSSWEKIIGLQAYNANLYMVDAGVDDIYKYTGGESGFSEKASYLRSGKPDLTQANSLAIDSALYIGLPDRVLKYLSGVKEDFNLLFVTVSDEVRMKKVVAGKDMEYIYAWEKEKGAVSVFNKEGQYQFQVRSQGLSKASDITVYNTNIYALSENKIFRFPLE